MKIGQAVNNSLAKQAEKLNYRNEPKSRLIGTVDTGSVFNAVASSQAVSFSAEDLKA